MNFRGKLSWQRRRSYKATATFCHLEMIIDSVCFRPGTPKFASAHLPFIP